MTDSPQSPESRRRDAARASIAAFMREYDGDDRVSTYERAALQAAYRRVSGDDRPIDPTRE